MRVLDADALTKKLLDCEFETNCVSEENKKEILKILRIFIPQIIANERPVDAEPIRHGRWIECDYKRLEHGMIETYPNTGYACSVCRTGFEKKKMTYKQYCPHCGAKMDGGDGNEQS